MHVETARSFQPFEYMAWAKCVAPGARFPMHVSGMPGPDPAVRFPVLSQEDWCGPPGPARVALAEKLVGWLGVPDGDIVIAGGASESLFVALAPFVRPGEPVIVEQPAYRALERAVQFLGGVPVRVERDAADRWWLDPARFDALLSTTGARLVGITDPHNPTGVSIDTDTRAAIIAVIERHRALLVVDEIFAPFRGHARPPAWPAQSSRVLSVGSLTKGWGLGSLRSGWVLGAPDLVRPCAQVFDLLGVNAPAGTLALASAALDAAPRLDAHARAAAMRARATLAATEWGAASLVLPDDAIFGFLKLPAGWRSEEAVAALRALDHVQVVPGHFFGCDDHLRIGFAGDTFDPAEGCRRIAARLNER